MSTRRLGLIVTMAAGLAGCATTHAMMPRGDVRSKSAAAILSDFRTARGLSRSTPDSALERAALQQARFMASASRMEHTTARGRDFVARLKDNEIETAAAENVASGTDDIGRVFQMWEQSPPHRKNMLDPRFGRFGLASAKDAAGRSYWALVLAQ